jgi:hypothetical protein
MKEQEQPTVDKQYKHNHEEIMRRHPENNRTMSAEMAVPCTPVDRGDTDN